MAVYVNTLAGSGRGFLPLSLSTLRERGARAADRISRMETGLSERLPPFALLAMHVTVLVALFALLDAWLRTTGHLGEQAYSQPVLALELGRRLSGDALFLLLASGLLILRHRSLWLRWEEIEHGTALRAIILLAAFIAAWTFSTYDFNLYFNQGHYFDRTLLIALFLLVLWRPVFVFPFLLLEFTLISQLDYPTGRYPWTEINLILRVLVLFCAFFLLRAVSRRIKSWDFIFTLLALVAANYWHSGFGKLRINWITHRHLNMLLPGAYTNGWLRFAPPEFIAAAARRLAALNLPLMLFTLVVEVGALVSLWRRRLYQAFLVGWIGFHLGIFAYTGMLFWKWVVLEVGLLWFLHSRISQEALPIFTRDHFLVSMVLIGGGMFWFRPRNLSWFDTRVSYTYRFEAVGESGATYDLPSGTFSPYTDEFTLGGFQFLSPEPQLTFIYGIASSRAHAHQVMQAATPQDVMALESVHRSQAFDPQETATLDRFLRVFFTNWGQRGSNLSALSWLKAPRHLWTFARGPAYQGQEPVARVDVHRVTALFDDLRYTEFRNERIHSVAIP